MADDKIEKLQGFIIDIIKDQTEQVEKSVEALADGQRISNKKLTGLKKQQDALHQAITNETKTNLRTSSDLQKLLKILGGETDKVTGIKSVGDKDLLVAPSGSGMIPPQTASKPPRIWERLNKGITLRDENPSEQDLCEHLNRHENRDGSWYCHDCGYNYIINEEKEPTRQTNYIKKKSIYLAEHYYPCNIVNCPIKEASLAYEGNYYCIRHFVEMVQDDRCGKEDLEFLFDLVDDLADEAEKFDHFPRFRKLEKKYLEEERES